MGFKNTSTEYGILSKFFHWTIAFIMMGLLVVGFYMVSLEPAPFKFEVYSWHKSFGILVLILVVGRIFWKFSNSKLEHMATHKKWEKILAKITHLALYVGMIGMPLSGWAMSSAAGYPVKLFGLTLPALVAENKALGSLMNQTHEILGYVLIGAILLHTAGAFKHHFIDRDSTLKRMLIQPLEGFMPYLLVFVVGLFFAGAAYFILLN